MSPKGFTDTQRLERLERLVRKYPMGCGEVLLEVSVEPREEPVFRIVAYDDDGENAEQYPANGYGESLRDCLDALIQDAP